ncbi:uncharacterized protein LOC133929665 isoform X2 [Phragmites australis]|uniref:uncharacterized protein LOC133929665 isoform X2 n=1 Tax=Phragmites australis TaxID=29695 RepID=UPI002D77F7C4|nr:uncharacterized protein LOC133929665 isoform X2 [Phragmites australis]
MKKTKSAAAGRQPHAQNGHVLPSKLAKYLDPDASLDKDQLLDAVHWIRQVLGLVCGLLWGAVPLVGAVWIALLTRKTLEAMVPYFRKGSLPLSPFSCFHGFWYTVWLTSEKPLC